MTVPKPATEPAPHGWTYTLRNPRTGMFTMAVRVLELLEVGQWVQPVDEAGDVSGPELEIVQRWPSPPAQKGNG